VKGASAAGIVAISVGKAPGRNEFFRTHPEFRPIVPMVNVAARSLPDAAASRRALNSAPKRGGNPNVRGALRWRQRWRSSSPAPGRTGETISALLTVLAATIALTPNAARSPTQIRKLADELHKRLRKRVAIAENGTEFQNFVCSVFRDGNVAGSA
jgi:hypothetical protein